MGKVKKFIFLCVALIMIVSMVNVSVKADSAKVDKHYISKSIYSNDIDYIAYLKSCSDKELEQQAIDYENLNIEFIKDAINRVNDPNYSVDERRFSRSTLIQNYNDELNKITNAKSGMEAKLGELNSTEFTNNKDVLHDLLVALDDEDYTVDGIAFGNIATTSNYNFDGILTGENTTYTEVNSYNNGYPIEFKTINYRENIGNYEDDNGIIDDANNQIPTESKSALYKVVLSLEKKIDDLTADEANSKKQISDLNSEIATLKQSVNSNAQATKQVIPNSNKQVDNKTVNNKKLSTNKKHKKVIQKKHKKLTKLDAKKLKADKKAITKINKKLKSKHLTKKHRRSLLAKRTQLRKAVRKLAK